MAQTDARMLMDSMELRGIGLYRESRSP